ncbi:MAG: hypothetical protein SGILL_003975 [Bacillariaceae sp.]
MGHEIRDTLDQQDDEEEGGDADDASAGGVDKVTNIISDDDMSEVSDLSNHEDEPSYEEEVHLKIVEPADVHGVQMSYGDLATFAHTQASSFLPDDDVLPDLTRKGSGVSTGTGYLPEIDEGDSFDPITASMGTMGSILDAIPMKDGDAGTEKSKKKGMKGLLRRFKKGKGDSDSKPPPPPLPPPSSPFNFARHMPPGQSPTMQQASVKVPPAATAKQPATNPMRNQIVKTAEDLIDKCALPYATSYRCALLFVDISGFTKLSRLLDPESLSKAINTYFQLIVDEVLDGKGDLLKFAGDAVFIEWKASKDCSLESCVESAVNCATKILWRCADFSVLSNGATGNCSYLLTSQAAQVETLNVHCGIGAGQMVGVHVGDHKSRREYILLGQPISQATVATDFAQLGEVAISPEAHNILSRVCEFKPDAAKNDGKTPTVVANRHEYLYSSKEKLGIHHRKIVNDISRGITSHVEGLEVDALRKYRRMMSLYVHPVVVDNDLAASHNIKSKKVKKIDQSEQERHREEAEIRNVFTMFVNPMVDTKVTNDEARNQQMYQTLNDVMNLSTREIERFHGHLRQFIVDDKGLVMIITFGLRGTTVPNMISHRALPAGIAIHNSLKLELGIDSRIGATIGEAYCGVVGGVKRHEYAVLGPSVNLAARLMASKTNPGILVDNRVRMMANRSFGFNALPPVVAKGYSEPVPIFEPLSSVERYWGKIVSNFVGRKEEIKTILQNTTEMMRKSSDSRFLLIESKSGVGKSTAMAHGIEHVRRQFNPKKNQLVVVKNVSKESDSLVPFG